MTPEQNALIEANLHRVPIIAHIFKRRLPETIEFDELVSCGNLRLVQCAVRFDTNRGISFATFADSNIRGAMKDFLRSIDLSSRRERRQEGGPPARCYVPLSVTLTSTDRSPAQFEARQDLRTVIEKARLSEQSLFVINQRYLFDRSQKELAKDLGVTAGRVSQIEFSAITQIRAANRPLIRGKRILRGKRKL